MNEDKTWTFQRMYISCCKALIYGIVLTAAVLTFIFTPTNPIFKAAFEGRIDAIHNYLAEGGGINAQDQYNNTALHWAAKGNQMKTVEYLVNRGIDCSIRNNQGDTALHWSVMSNNETLIRYLVMQRMDVNALNNEGETPLHLAIMMNAFPSAHALLHLHADPNVIAKNGNAPLHYLAPGCSEDEKCRQLVDEFKKAGCNMTIENKQHFSVFQVVMNKKNDTLSAEEL